MKKVILAIISFSFIFGANAFEYRELHIDNNMKVYVDILNYKCAKGGVEINFSDSHLAYLIGVIVDNEYVIQHKLDSKNIFFKISDSDESYKYNGQKIKKFSVLLLNVITGGVKEIGQFNCK